MTLDARFSIALFRVSGQQGALHCYVKIII